MDPAAPATPTPSQIWRRGVDYLYRHARSQFHPGLYVLLYAALLTAALSVAMWVLGFFIQPRRVVDYQIIGTLAVCTAVAELIRGHVKHWLRASSADWSFKAMAAGGAALGATLWLTAAVRWHGPDLLRLVVFCCVGATLYVVLGYLFRLQERKRLEQEP